MTGFKNRLGVISYGLLVILLAVGLTACGGGGGGSSSGGGGGTPTPSTPAPTINVTASKMSVNPGEAVTFTWTSSNATKVELTESVYSTSLSSQSTDGVRMIGALTEKGCTLYADPNHVHTEETVTSDESRVTSDLTAQETLATGGSKTVYPSKSTTYTFTVIGNGGSTPKSITIAAETVTQKDAWVKLYNAWNSEHVTVRWVYGNIEVYDGTNSPVFQESLDVWNEILKGFVTLKKSANPNSPITINTSTNLPSNVAGTAGWEGDGTNDGINAKGTILIHPNYVSDKYTYMHELGHVLGFFIHTTEPGLMNATASAQITPQVIGMMTRLYELPIKTYMP